MAEFSKMNKGTVIAIIFLVCLFTFGGINTFLISQYGTLTEGKVLKVVGKNVVIQYLNKNYKVCECTVTRRADETSVVGNHVKIKYHPYFSNMCRLQD